jgi:hypothetical protein
MRRKAHFFLLYIYIKIKKNIKMKNIKMKNSLAENMRRFGTKNLNEAELNQQQKQAINDTVLSCWNSKKYPLILDAAEGAGYTIGSIGLAIVGILTAPEGVGFALLSLSASSGTMAFAKFLDAFITKTGATKSDSLTKELASLFKCITTKLQKSLF